ncbi:URT1 [Symbiodinium natans]|uniref:URT1 protein n=1 Tax=Symbiodinium natans TaxID=878477 RepID=A0A812K2P6_9DINO|nr:URT1 [Symbiodinium natans]
MKGSDVDACLVIPRCARKQSWLTKLRLVQSLVISERMGSVELVRGARVPVAKIRNSEGDDLCDVSINNVAALENSRFVGVMSSFDARVPRLGRFIKHWASQRRINNRSEGTLSTYTLILQLFYSLQLRDPPVLPRVTCMLCPDLLLGGIRWLRRRNT